MVNLINQAGGKAVGLTGKDGRMIHAKKLLLQNRDNHADLIDIGMVGDTKIDALINHLQAGAFDSVLRQLALVKTEKPTTSTRTSSPARSPKFSRLKKLVLLTNTPGVLDKDGKLVTDVTPKQIDAMVEDGTLYGGMLPKISSALDAARSGCQKRAYH